jgi:hypothetical protein
MSICGFKTVGGAMEQGRARFKAVDILDLDRKVFC